jgi:triosephosphate isomerase
MVSGTIFPGRIMRKPLVAGNWKLNGTRESNGHLVQGVLEAVSALEASEVMVCPPYVYLGEIAGTLAGTRVLVGAQNVSTESTGAFTGEISATMLRDIGCSHVIVGHSERRSLYGETDNMVATKFKAALAEGLDPILCVGETREERENGVTMDVVDRQIGAVLALTGGAAFSTAVIAYEPVWAIGTGLTATPDQAQAVHAHIRAVIAAADAKIGMDIRILYGGSVKSGNAAELFAKDDIDGGLIGGASLDATEFAAICQAAAETNS